ncbi:MAG: putative tyrosine recombinase XerC-like protein [Methanosaeta sp. PtaU1.Bin060]|nr:MAG: putative tyrosine recombinase XerC-like protein [Methanosaeta sp. PtaU1.Bin060]
MVDDLIGHYLVDCEVRGMAPGSLPRYRSALKIFISYLGEKDLREAGREDLIGFIRWLRKDRECSQKTIENYFSTLSSFYKFLEFEEIINVNPVPPIRERYLRRYKDNGDSYTRKLISVEDAARMLKAEPDIRNKAMLAILFKTGIRRGELVTLDVSDVNLVENTIRLKPTAKRSNRSLFMDDEAAYLLRRWLRVREGINRREESALFLSSWGYRISRNDVYRAVTEAAKRVGLHDPSSKRLEDHFGPHCCRHWFCTHLFRAGMRREFIKELRGDSKKEAFDLYNHIDLKELKEAYLACIPQLGI